MALVATSRSTAQQLEPLRAERGGAAHASHSDGVSENTRRRADVLVRFTVTHDASFTASCDFDASATIDPSIA